MADDHAKRAISAYGYDLVETPNIDRIANEGVLFRNAFVTNSICSPSRAVLLTGKFSHLNGVRNNGQAFDGSQQVFPRILQEAGYQTSVVGKWHLKSEPTGFDEWQILIGQGEYYSPRFLSMDGTVQYEGAYTSDKITDIALDVLEKRDKNKPFMMLYQHKAPHRNWMPYVEDLDLAEVRDIQLPISFEDDYAGRPAAQKADMRIADMFLSYDMKLQKNEYEVETGTGGAKGNPEGVKQAIAAWRESYNRMTSEQKIRWDDFYSKVNAEYQQIKDQPKALARWKYQRYLHDYILTVRALDNNIGRVLDYLDKNGLSENTIVIYTSDQGFYLGEHGWYDKRFMYEQSMLTPLILRYPAQIAPGQEVTELVQNLDFAPTILDLVGLPIPREMQGLSLVPLTMGTSNNSSWRSGLYYHYYGNVEGWHRVPTHYGIRTDRYKLIHFQDGLDHWELYDLQKDPYEQESLYGAAEYSKLQRRLHKELSNLRNQYKVSEK